MYIILSYSIRHGIIFKLFRFFFLAKATEVEIFTSFLKLQVFSSKQFIKSLICTI